MVLAGCSSIDKQRVDFSPPGSSRVTEYGMLSKGVWYKQECPTPDPVIETLNGMISGIYTLETLQATIAAAPQHWRPLVFTNGCFDLIHAGHVRYLQAAKQLGRALVIGLNSDDSVRTIKPQSPGSPPRPIVPEAQRAEVLAALKPVDGVVVFAETTASQLLAALQPEVYAKGGDYQIASLPEAMTVQSYGGRIELINIEIPSSTSAIIGRILAGAEN